MGKGWVVGNAAFGLREGNLPVGPFFGIRRVVFPNYMKQARALCLGCSGRS